MSVISIKPGETLVVIALQPVIDNTLPTPPPGPVDPGYSPPWAQIPDVPVDPEHPWVPPEIPPVPVDPGYSPPWAQVPVDPGYGIPETPKPPTGPVDPGYSPPWAQVPDCPDGGSGNWTWAWSPQQGRWVWVRTPGKGEAGPKSKKG